MKEKEETEKLRSVRMRDAQGGKYEGKITEEGMTRSDSSMAAYSTPPQKVASLKDGSEAAGEKGKRGTVCQ